MEKKSIYLFTTSRNKNAVMIHNSFISMHLFDTRTLKLITGRFFSLFFISLLSCISAMSSLIIVNHFGFYVLGCDPLIQRYEKLCYLSALNFFECSVIVAAAEDVVAMHWLNLVVFVFVLVRDASQLNRWVAHWQWLGVRVCIIRFPVLYTTLWIVIYCLLFALIMKTNIFTPAEFFSTYFCYSILICLNKPNEWNLNAFLSDRKHFFFNETRFNAEKYFFQ